VKWVTPRTYRLWRDTGLRGYDVGGQPDLSWRGRNDGIAMMAAGIATVPLAELAHDDGTPRSGLMNQANRAFDAAEARNAGNPRYQPYPADAPRHLGLIAEAVLAERAAIREAVTSTMAAPGTEPESAEVTAIIERMRAGESPVAIARETGALQERVRPQPPSRGTGTASTAQADDWMRGTAAMLMVNAGLAAGTAVAVAVGVCSVAGVPGSCAVPLGA
jgi:hypothetical protein